MKQPSIGIHNASLDPSALITGQELDQADELLIRRFEEEHTRMMSEISEGDAMRWGLKLFLISSVSILPSITKFYALKDRLMDHEMKTY